LKVLSEKIFAFKQAIEKSKGSKKMESEDVQGKAAELYDILIRPIQDDLAEARTRTVVASLDGPLRYLPMSALYKREEKQYLIERYALAMFTEAARDKLRDRPDPRAVEGGGARNVQSGGRF